MWSVIVVVFLLECRTNLIWDRSLGTMESTSMEMKRSTYQSLPWTLILGDGMLRQVSHSVYIEECCEALRGSGRELYAQRE